MKTVNNLNKVGYEYLLRIYRETDLGQEKARILSMFKLLILSFLRNMATNISLIFLYLAFTYIYHTKSRGFIYTYIPLISEFFMLFSQMSSFLKITDFYLKRVYSISGKELGLYNKSRISSFFLFFNLLVRTVCKCKAIYGRKFLKEMYRSQVFTGICSRKETILV